MWMHPLNPRSRRFSKDSKEWLPGSQVKTHMGQHMLWLEFDQGGRHLDAADLDAYRHIGDWQVDEIFRLMGSVAPGEDVVARAAEAYQKSQTTTNNLSELESALASFYKIYTTVPEWVDWDQIRRGQEVFLAYLPAISLSLYYRSLVPGFSIPSLAHVLKTTGYLAPPSSKQRVQERLLDTGALLAQTMTQADALQPGMGQGWKACLWVRILHAKVRRGISRRTQTRAWDTETLGVPINEEEMAATLLAFSINALVGVEILLGFPIPRQEQRDYLALWRYLGWLLGVRVAGDDMAAGKGQPMPRALDPCGPGWIENKSDSVDHSCAMLESFILHLLHPDESSIEIAHHLLWQGRVHEKQNSKDQTLSKNWFYYRCLSCRRFVGDPLADALQLPLNPNIWYRWQSWLCSSMILSMISLYTFLGLPWSPCRRYIVDFHRNRFVEFAQSWDKEHMRRVQERLPAEAKICHFAMLMSPSDKNEK